eukprot:gene3334-2463_t
MDSRKSSRKFTSANSAKKLSPIPGSTPRLQSEANFKAPATDLIPAKIEHVKGVLYCRFEGFLKAKNDSMALTSPSDNITLELDAFPESFHAASTPSTLSMLSHSSEVESVLEWGMNSSYPLTWSPQQRKASYVKVSLYQQDGRYKGNGPKKFIAMASIDLPSILTCTDRSYLCCLPLYSPDNVANELQTEVQTFWRKVLSLDTSIHHALLDLPINPDLLRPSEKILITDPPTTSYTVHMALGELSLTLMAQRLLTASMPMNGGATATTALDTDLDKTATALATTSAPKLFQAEIRLSTNYEVVSTVIGEYNVATGTIQWSPADLVLPTQALADSSVLLDITLRYSNGETKRPRLQAAATAASSSLGIFTTKFAYCNVCISWAQLSAGRPVNISVPMRDQEDIRIGNIAMRHISQETGGSANLPGSSATANELDNNSNTVNTTAHVTSAALYSASDVFFESLLLVHPEQPGPTGRKQQQQQQEQRRKSRSGFIPSHRIQQWSLASRILIPPDVSQYLSKVRIWDAVSVGIMVRTSAYPGCPELGRARVALPIQLFQEYAANKPRNVEQFVTFYSYEPQTQYYPMAAVPELKKQFAGRVRVRISLQRESYMPLHRSIAEKAASLHKPLSPRTIRPQLKWSHGLGAVMVRLLGINSSRQAHEDCFDERILFASMTKSMPKVSRASSSSSSSSTAWDPFAEVVNDRVILHQESYSQFMLPHPAAAAPSEDYHNVLSTSSVVGGTKVFSSATTVQVELRSETGLSTLATQFPASKAIPRLPSMPGGVSPSTAMVPTSDTNVLNPSVQSVTPEFIVNLTKKSLKQTAVRVSTLMDGNADDGQQQQPLPASRSLMDAKLKLQACLVPYIEGSLLIQLATPVFPSTSAVANLPALQPPQVHTTPLMARRSGGTPAASTAAPANASANITSRGGGSSDSSSSSSAPDLVWLSTTVDLYRPSTIASSARKQVVGRLPVRIAFRPEAVPFFVADMLQSLLYPPLSLLTLGSTAAATAADATSGPSSSSSEEERLRIELGLKQAFVAADTDGSGAISAAELVAVIHAGSMAATNTTMMSGTAGGATTSSSTSALSTATAMTTSNKAAPRLGLENTSQLLRTLAQLSDSTNGGGSSSRDPFNAANGRSSGSSVRMRLPSTQLLTSASTPALPPSSAALLSQGGLTSASTSRLPLAATAAAAATTAMPSSNEAYDIMRLFRQLDLDGDGTITWCEWQSELPLRIVPVSTTAANNNQTDETDWEDAFSVMPKQYANTAGEPALTTSTTVLDQPFDSSSSSDHGSNLPLLPSSKVSARLNHLVQSLRLTNSLVAQRVDSTALTTTFHDPTAEGSGGKGGSAPGQDHHQQQQQQQQQDRHEQQTQLYVRAFRKEHHHAQTLRNEVLSLQAEVDHLKAHPPTDGADGHQSSKATTARIEQSVTEITTVIAERLAQLEQRKRHQEQEARAQRTLTTFLTRYALPRQQARREAIARQRLLHWLTVHLRRRHLRDHLAQKQHAAVTIQQRLRGLLVRQQWRLQLHMATRLQRLFRGFRARREAAQRRRHREQVEAFRNTRAMRLIARVWRAFHQRRVEHATRVIGESVHRYCLRRQARTRLESLRQQRQRATHLLACIVRIQRSFRRWRLRRYARQELIRRRVKRDFYQHRAQLIAWPTTPSGVTAAGGGTTAAVGAVDIDVKDVVVPEHLFMRIDKVDLSMRVCTVSYIPQQHNADVTPELQTTVIAYDHPNMTWYALQEPPKDETPDQRHPHHHHHRHKEDTEEEDPPAEASSVSSSEESVVSEESEESEVELSQRDLLLAAHLQLLLHKAVMYSPDGGEMASRFGTVTAFNLASPDGSWHPIVFHVNGTATPSGGVTPGMTTAASHYALSAVANHPNNATTAAGTAAAAVSMNNTGTEPSGRSSGTHTPNTVLGATPSHGKSMHRLVAVATSGHGNAPGTVSPPRRVVVATPASSSAAVVTPSAVSKHGDNANRVLVEIAPSASLASVPDAPAEVERFYLVGWDEEYPWGRFFRDCRISHRNPGHCGNESEDMIIYLVSIGTLHPANVQRVKISSTHRQVEFYLLNHPGYRYVGLEPRVGRAIRRLYGDKVETIGAGGHGDEEDVIEGLGLGSG